MGFWGVLRVKMWKFCLLTPKRHYPAWIRVCWCIVWQNRFNGLSSRSVEWFCVQRRNKKKLSGKFGYMGRSNPWGDLDQMWLVGRYGGRNHVCNISWLSVKGCGCGERNKFAFSHWLHASPLQHWTHYGVTVWWLLCGKPDDFSATSQQLIATKFGHDTWIHVPSNPAAVANGWWWMLCLRSAITVPCIGPYHRLISATFLYAWSEQKNTVTD